MVSPPEIPNPESELDKDLISIMSNSFRRVYRSGGLGAITIYLFLLLKRAVLNKLTFLGLILGAGAGLLFALGQSYGIGFHPAWKLYGSWWLLSPRLGPALLLFMVAAGSIGEFIGRLSSRKAKVIGGSLAIIGIGAAILFGGYEGTREDNPLLSSQPANLEGLSKSIRQQTQVLGDLSESGKTLLGQLNATEFELETAKKQLVATLGNFDAQRNAAGHVTEELKRLDVRQKQIALQTEELERILEGQQPITRHDLQRANLQGLISGLGVGFLASFLASMAYNAWGKRKPLSS